MFFEVLSSLNSLHLSLSDETYSALNHAKTNSITHNYTGEANEGRKDSVVYKPKYLHEIDRK